MTAYLFFLLITAFLSFMLSAILFVFPRIDSTEFKPNRYLSACYFFVGHALIVSFLISARLIEAFPHLFFTTHFAIYMFIPMPYLYMRRVLKRRIITRDIFHFIPALIYVIDMSWFLFKPAAFKLGLIQDYQRQMDIALLTANGLLLPDRFHLVFTDIIIMLYLIWQYVVIFQARRTYGKVILLDNKSWFFWLFFLTTAELICLAPIGFAIFFGLPISALEIWRMGSILFSTMVLISGIYLLLRPEILYGIRGLMIPRQVTDSDAEPEYPAIAAELEKNSKAAYYVPQSEAEQLLSLMDKLMLKEKLYLNSDLTIAEVATLLNVPIKLISASVNQFKQCSFPDYVNVYRVQHCQVLMTDPSNKHLTLQAIAEASGFGNRTSFVNAFKRFTGETPSGFYKKLKNESDDAHNTEEIE